MNIKRIDVPNELFELKKDSTKEKENKYGFKKNDIVYFEFEDDSFSASCLDGLKFYDENGIFGIYNNDLYENENMHEIKCFRKIDDKYHTVYVDTNISKLFKTEKQSIGMIK